MQRHVRLPCGSAIAAPGHPGLCHRHRRVAAAGLRTRLHRRRPVQRRRTRPGLRPPAPRRHRERGLRLNGRRHAREPPGTRAGRVRTHPPPARPPTSRLRHPPARPSRGCMVGRRPLCHRRRSCLGCRLVCRSQVLRSRCRPVLQPPVVWCSNGTDRPGHCRRDKNTSRATALVQTLTVARCAALCNSGNFGLIALTDGTECLCGTNVSAPRAAADSNCSAPCIGDVHAATLDARCGGSGASSVYRIARNAERMQCPPGFRNGGGLVHDPVCRPCTGATCSIACRAAGTPSCLTCPQFTTDGILLGGTRASPV